MAEESENTTLSVIFSCPDYCFTCKNVTYVAVLILGGACCWGNFIMCVKYLIQRNLWCVVVLWWILHTWYYYIEYVKKKCEWRCCVKFGGSQKLNVCLDTDIISKESYLPVQSYSAPRVIKSNPSNFSTKASTTPKEVYGRCDKHYFKIDIRWQDAVDRWIFPFQLRIRA